MCWRITWQNVVNLSLSRQQKPHNPTQPPPNKHILKHKNPNRQQNLHNPKHVVRPLNNKKTINIKFSKLLCISFNKI